MEIRISELYKSFNGKPVLSGFSDVFPEGKTTAVMGPSGCGKTTLLNILWGFVKPESGAVTGLPGRITAVFQEDRLCESFNAVTNVQLACTDNAPSRETVCGHLTALGLGDSLQKPVSALSGGMRRRVAIARAVLAGGELIVMDEPFKGLDEDTKAAVMDYVRRETAGRTVILVTHDIKEAEELGDSIIRMKENPVC